MPSDGDSHVSNGNSDAVPPAFSEDAVALVFAGRHALDFRFVPQHGKWFRWDGSRWAPDDLLHAPDALRAVCREKAEQFSAFLEENDKSQAPARTLASSRFTAGVERLTRSDRRLALSATVLDADPLLLSTPNGVVDLRTGKMREARRDDYITRSTRVTPGGDCPIWDEFLVDATGEDGELTAYLRRLAGYCLTGTVEEHLAFFLYGPAAAGKSTFTETLSWILGDYAVASPIELLTPQGNEHPTILASLDGVRLSVMSETEGGRAIAESRFKSLVAGDLQAARFMRQDYFYFNPQCKLILHGNHRPRLKNTDESMRRRVHVIPFTEVVPPEHRDKKLKDRLRKEAPGILAWTIQGCMEWHREGLNPPSAVIGARDDYFESEDVLGRWLDESCIQGDGFTATRLQLWNSWCEWAERNGEPARSNRWFYQQLRARGFGETKETGIRKMTGISVVD
jgi:putative DNA primase/helicase